MSCKQATFAGWGTCKQLLTDMVGATIEKKGADWTNQQALSFAEWKDRVSGITGATVLPLPITGFASTTDEAEITTSQLGKKYKTKNAIPSGTLYLDASIVDYKQLYAIDGQQFNLMPWFDGGNFWMTENQDGSRKGLSCRLAMVAGFAPDDKTQSFPVHVFFDSYSEFENLVVFSPTFTFDDVLNETPAGLDVQITSAYDSTTGLMDVLVTKRGTGEPYEGLTFDQFVAISASFGTGAPYGSITDGFVDGSQGAYTLQVMQGTETLSDANTVTLQAQDDDATNITYLSNIFYATGDGDAVTPV